MSWIKSPDACIGLYLAHQRLAYSTSKANHLRLQQPFCAGTATIGLGHPNAKQKHAHKAPESPNRVCRASVSRFVLEIWGRYLPLGNLGLGVRIVCGSYGVYEGLKRGLYKVSQEPKPIGLLLKNLDLATII